MNILLTIGIILLALWLLNFFIPIPFLGWFIHIALIIAVILIVIWLLRKVFKLF